MKALGYAGFEGLWSKDGEVGAEIKIPIVLVGVTFAVFMVFILALYLYLLKKEKQREKKNTQVLGYETKSLYS